MPPRALILDFWDHVDCSSPDGCWPWMRGRDKDGYGKLRTVAEGYMRAHRVAFEKAVGPVPEGMIVCHSCDNPPCCRPDHLFLGDWASNMQDRDVKGRGARFPQEANPMAKLTLEDACAILAMSREGRLQREIAAHFGITQSNVSRIVLRKTWVDAA